MPRPDKSSHDRLVFGDGLKTKLIHEFDESLTHSTVSSIIIDDIFVLLLRSKNDRDCILVWLISLVALDLRPSKTE